MKRRTRALAGLALAVVTAGVVVHELVLAQPAPGQSLPDAAESNRAEWEFARLTALAQEAFEHLQRRRELVGNASPQGLQPLMSEATRRVRELNQAAQQRDLNGARSAFRLAMGLLEEIRLQLNEAIDAQQAAEVTPEQAAARLQSMVEGLRRRQVELERLSSQNGIASIDAEFARVDGLIRQLQARATAQGPLAVHDQVVEVRQSLQSLEVTILDRAQGAR